MTKTETIQAETPLHPALQNGLGQLALAEGPASASPAESIYQHQAALQMAAEQPAGGDDGHGTSWRLVESHGSNQVVSIVEFNPSEGGSLPVVLRPTEVKEYKERYANYPAVRKYFPELYGVAVDQSGRDVLAMEKIEGQHGDGDLDNLRRFQELVTDPGKFEQLCTDMFEVAEAIHATPLTLDDIRPPRGHNVIYDEHSGKFRLFDVESLHPSDGTHVEKFLQNFIGTDIMPADRPEETAFIRRMLQMYQAAHPETGLSYVSEPTSLADYEIVPDPDSFADEGELFRPEDEGYAAAWRRAGGTFFGQRFDKPPAFRRVIQEGRYVTSVDADVLEAVSRDDDAALAAIIRDRGGITSQRFEPSPKSQAPTPGNAPAMAGAE